MARFIPKQFAKNSTTSVVFGSFQEQGGNVGDGTISSDPATLQGGTAWPLGWSAATDNFLHIPRGEEIEGLERVLSAAIIQQFTDGLTFWQSQMPVTQYQTIVQYQTGNDKPKLYLNITGTSTSTPPDSDTTNWFMFLDTGASYANVDLSNLSAAGNDKFVTKDTTQTITGAKTFSENTVLTGQLHLKNSVVSGAGIKFFNGNTEVADLFWNNSVETFNLTTANGGAYVGLRCAAPLTATDDSARVPTTNWCHNIGVVNYSSGSDVTATVFAASGTGYKPSYKGVLFISSPNDNGTSILYIYDANGGAVTNFNIHYSGGVGNYQMFCMPVSSKYSFRVTGNAAGNSALFFPFYTG